MPHFMQLFAEPEPIQAGICANPRLAMLRFNRSLFLGTTAFFAVSIFLFAVFFLVNMILGFPPNPFPWSFFFPLLIFLLNVGVLSAQLHFWERIEPWRLAAARGEERLLAEDQPEPSAEGLRLPVTIRVSPLLERRISSKYGLFALLLIVAYLFCTLLVFASFSFFLSLLIAVLVGGVLGVLGLVLLRRFRRPIEMSQEGIRFRTQKGGSAFMLWHEARLFACYPEPGPWTERAVIMYELSSASYVVYWSQVRRTSPRDLLAGPALPLGEHQAQIDALNRFVVAKTGLALYDLSKGPVLSS